MKNWIYLVVPICFVTLWGCKTQKVKGEYSGLKKLYHNTTMRYNGYYNATVLLAESELELSESYVDNYNKILPVFPYEANDNPKAIAEKLDDAMERISVAVNLHRGAVWTDDSYLIFGQAQYLKQEYEASEETFEFMEVEFSNDPKKRGSLSQASRDRKAQTKSEREAYRKQREKELAEARKERDEARADEKKERMKTAKKKKKERLKERKEKSKEIKRKKREREQARKKARKSGGKAPSRSTQPTNKIDPVNKEIKNNSKANEDQGKDEKDEVVESKEEKEPKIDSENQSFFLKHRPNYNVGMLWLARSYIAQGKYTLADSKLRRVEEAPNNPMTLQRVIPVVRSNFFLKQKKYHEAKPFLEEAIEMSRDRFRKARFAFILAQIEEQAGNWKDAQIQYNRVLKFKPRFEMDFATKLKLIKGQFLNGKTDIAETEKKLHGMLKEFKYNEYLDQINYALAKVVQGNGDKDKAIEYLEASLAVPSSNQANQIEAYYELANIYLENDDYVNAKSFFDSALGLMNKLDERYIPTKAIAENLTDIASNLTELTLQDSLLRLSMLSNEELKEKALEIKKARNAAKRKAILLQSQGNVGGRTVNLNSQNPSNFFAYDIKAVRRGVKEFVKKYGDRPLEDNWRRGTEDLFEDDVVEEIETFSDNIITDEELEKMFKDIPKTSEDKDATRSKIQDALFNLGRLYRDKLVYHEKSIESLNKLITDYPETPHKAEALYYLFLNYNDVGDLVSAKLAKRKLIEDFAHTKFGKVVKDPKYVENLKQAESKLANYYEDTYKLFEQGQYRVVHTKIEKATDEFGETNNYSPRFALLKAMTNGNLEGKKQYVQSLKKLIADFPKSQEAIKARELLRLLDADASNDIVVDTSSIGDSQENKYKLADNKLHYIIIVFKNDNSSINDSKIAISDFNKKYYKLDKLRISSIQLGEKDNRKPLIVVRRFKDKEKAMDYYYSSKKNGEDFLQGNNFSVFSVTQENYRTILTTKSIDGYPEFFNKNYLVK